MYVCMPACLHVHRVRAVPCKARRGWLWAAHCGCWALKPGLQEQGVLLTAEPSFQSLPPFLSSFLGLLVYLLAFWDQESGLHGHYYVDGADLRFLMFLLLLSTKCYHAQPQGTYNYLIMTDKNQLEYLVEAMWNFSHKVSFWLLIWHQCLGSVCLVGFY